MRTMLRERTDDGIRSQSAMEDRMASVLRKAGLPPPRRQYGVELRDCTIHVDFAYPSILLAIECDGYAWHMDRDAFERDRVRDVELQALGWTVLRFTWSQVRWRPSYVVDHIREHLAPHLASRMRAS